MLIVGFDPGGKGTFGWCVAEVHGTQRVRLRRSGTADHAAPALQQIRQYVADPSEIGAAGIDSPLFWVANGERQADRTIRAAMTALGATSASGTVQQLNSLWGACLVQGIMAAEAFGR